MSDDTPAAPSTREGPADRATTPPMPPESAQRIDSSTAAPAPLKPPSPGIHSSNFRFPAGFLWGSATSAHQVEGNCTNNDWWQWEQAGKVSERSGLACDHYRRFREDFDLARELGHNAHRFSIEWSRIEPEEGTFSVEAIVHYREVLEALKERGIEPIVTLHHYTLPRWLADQGGWENPEIVKWFERYVTRMVAEYGDLVCWWITLNEPVVHVFKSYIIGQWPPGKRDYPAAFRVLRYMLRAHVLAYRAIHERRPDARVSVAQHCLALTPCDPRSWLDRASVRVRSYLFNELFLDALHSGTLRVPGRFWERLAPHGTLDFIGVNYYTRDFVKNTGINLPGFIGNLCTIDHHQSVGKRNDLGWEVYPEGLARFLESLRRMKLPILITENGVPASRDIDRWVFIFMHLWQVARALEEEIPVVGYLYWSLLDNYEWADGFTPRFGLIAVDYATQERVVRDSARNFAEILKRNEL